MSMFSSRVKDSENSQHRDIGYGWLWILAFVGLERAGLGDGNCRHGKAYIMTQSSNERTREKPTLNRMCSLLTWK